ncbi:MAG: IS66 family insertion sequence element accessory protein TnpB [Spirochaetales bacterium]|nr:IS66 family insertion sequence element accessory protein TnpB [Spirochaetales bacterium]
MRKQINGLSIIVKEELKMDVFTGNMYMFCNRSRQILKIIYWDRNGFCLWIKRLEKDKFPWPKGKDEVKEIDEIELKMLLDGIDFFHAYKRIEYEEIK